MSVKYLQTVGSFECIVEMPEAGWIGEQGEKRTPFIRIPLKVIGTENKDEVIVYRAWLSDGALDNTIRRLAEVFGFDGDLAALYDGKQTLAGLPCNIITEMENYDRKDRLKVAWLNPLGGGTVKPLDSAKVSSIIAKINSKSKAIAKTVSKAVSAAKPGSFESVVDNENDIPT